jgi:hypothetical protein
MKNRGLSAALILLGFIVVVVIAVIAMYFYFWQGPWMKAPQTTTELNKNLVNESSLKMTSGADVWQAAPPCANSPLMVRDWQKILVAGAGGVPAESYIQRAAMIGGDAEGAEVQGLTAPTAVGEYQALLLNIASGRLNRASEISLPDHPEVKTVGDLLAEAGQVDAAAEFEPAIEKVLSGEAVIQPVCANMVVLQAGGSLTPVLWTKGGVQEQTNPSMQAQATGLEDANPQRTSLDFGMSSPNGEWAAYTSLSMDAGGPIFVQNLQSGAWINLIEALNSGREADQDELNPTDWWTVIKWFPDSQRLLVGRSDTSSVLVANLEDSSHQVYAFAGEGNGGSLATDLSPDGRRFGYIGYDKAGDQFLGTYDFSDKKVAVIRSQPLNSGILYFPRFSPDGNSMAYLLQVGEPLTGISYSIQVVSLFDGSNRVLVPGNTGLTVPMWSPDGKYITYTRGESGSPEVITPGEAPAMESVNVWTVQVASGQQQQITTLAGQARSPVWSADGTTLAFVTEDGQVGMATLYQPGRMWLAAQASPEFPLLTSVFFVP